MGTSGLTMKWWARDAEIVKAKQEQILANLHKIWRIELKCRNTWNVKITEYLWNTLAEKRSF